MIRRIELGIYYMLAVVSLTWWVGGMIWLANN